MAGMVNLKGGRITAAVDPMGAQLKSLALDGREYLWQADPAWWAKYAPVLFPIVGTIRNGTAESAQGTVTLGRHGLARDYEHAVVAQSDDAVTFELVDTDATRAAYPYAFKLNMTYALTGPASMTQTFRVENTGSVDLPFSVGGHPAFNVPAPGAEGEAFDDYELAFTRSWSCVVPKVDDDGLITYRTAAMLLDHADVLPITHDLFAEDAVILTDVPDNTLTLRSRISGHGVRIDFEGFKYIGVWSAAGDAPFVALEPWTGHSTLDTEDDVFEHKRNITILEPGAVDERSFTVTLL